MLAGFTHTASAAVTLAAAAGMHRVPHAAQAARTTAPHAPPSTSAALQVCSYIGPGRLGPLDLSALPPIGVSLDGLLLRGAVDRRVGMPGGLPLPKKRMEVIPWWKGLGGTVGAGGWLLARCLRLHALQQCCCHTVACARGVGVNACQEGLHAHLPLACSWCCLSWNRSAASPVGNASVPRALQPNAG